MAEQNKASEGRGAPLEAFLGFAEQYHLAATTLFRFTAKLMRLSTSCIPIQSS